MVLRQRKGRGGLEKVVQDLDAFPKVPETYVEQTNSGAASEKVIFFYKGWKICPQICYDLRFPVFARNVEDYDLLFYVANWPKPRISAWDALLKARAIENMSYTIGVNRVGFDANNYEYPGHSVVYDCLGNNLTDLKPYQEDITTVTLTKKHQNKYREKLQFLNDRDRFTLM